MKKTLSLLLLTLAIGNHLQARQSETDTLPEPPVQSSAMSVVTTVVHEDRSSSRRPVATFSQLMEGLAAGVQVASGGSNPSVDSRLLVRGPSSLLFPTSPLVIVDGMPYTGGMFSLNLLDIEFLEIRKDAATTVRYGSRGANGVIEVTTKRGSAGKPQVNFQLSKGVSTRGVADYERVNVKDFMGLKWEALNSSYLSRGYTADDAARLTSEYLLSSSYLNNSSFPSPNSLVMTTDGTLAPGARLPFGDTGWDDALFQSGQRSEYAADISGGTDHSKYFISAGYLNDEGYVRYNGAKRYTARANVSVTPAKWLKLGLNVSGALEEVNNPSQLQAFSPIAAARLAGPIYPVYAYGSDRKPLIEKGSQVFSYSRALFNETNPVKAIQAISQATNTTQLTGLIYAQAQLLKGLTLDMSAGIDGATAKLNSKYTTNSSYDVLRSFTSNEKSWQSKQQLTYESKDDRQLFKSFVGFERLGNYASGSNFERSGSYPTYYNNTGELDRRTSGVFLGFLYTLDDKYTVASTLRTDRLPIYGSNVWYGFWSLSGAWIISEEDFIKNSNSIISQLRLRASIGRVGNDGISSYLSWNSMYSYFQDGVNSTSMGILNRSPSNIYGRDMEATNQTNLGLDVGLLNNRLYATVDFFNHKANHINSQTSFSQRSDGYYGLRNRGIEVTVSGSLISTRNLQWNVQLNATHYAGKLTHEGKYATLYDAGITFQQGLVEGESIFSFHLPTYVGVNPANGNPMYLAKNYKESTTAYRYNGSWVTESLRLSDDMDFNQGSAIPDLFGGIGSNLWYKNFSLSFLLSYQLGGKVYDEAYQQLMQCQPTNGYTMHTDLLNRWQKAGDNTNIPQIDRTIASSDFYLTSASYLSLRSLVLSYSLPKKLVEKMNMRRIEVYAAGENLWLLSARKGLYPTANLYGVAGNSYVPARTVSLGINVGF